MLKTETLIWLEHVPTWSDFLGHLESALDDVYFYMFGFP